MKELVFPHKYQVATTNDVRVCCICKTEKSLVLFPKHKSYPKGRHYRCCDCNAALSRKYYQANQEKERARRSAYGKGNKEYNAALSNRRRARRAANGGRHTMAEWKAKKMEYGNSCAVCKCVDKPLTRDHIIPLSKGGIDNIENIQPLCQSCNSKKSNKI